MILDFIKYPLLSQTFYYLTSCSPRSIRHLNKILILIFLNILESILDLLYEALGKCINYYNYAAESQ